MHTRCAIHDTECQLMALANSRAKRNSFWSICPNGLDMLLTQLDMRFVLDMLLRSVRFATGGSRLVPSMERLILPVGASPLDKMKKML